MELRGYFGRHLDHRDFGMDRYLKKVVGQGHATTDSGSKNMITGSLTLNGLDDKDMQLIFEMRAKTPLLLFNPSGITIRTEPEVPAKPGQIQAYNNVVMGWTEASGLAAVMELLKLLNQAQTTRGPTSRAHKKSGLHG